MYVLARNGQSTACTDKIEGDLLSQVLAKKEHLHAEGIAQVAFALSEAQVWDKEAWTLIKE